jgi:hypothetical protein
LLLRNEYLAAENRIFRALCVAITWPALLATLCNSEPVPNSVGAGREMKVSADDWRGTLRGPDGFRVVQIAKLLSPGICGALRVVV